MGYIGFLKKYRVLPNLSTRFFKILKRYGFNERRMKENIRLFVEDCNQFGICPTLPTLAQVLENNMDFFTQFDADQVEIALHGFYHQDYPSLSRIEKKELINMAFMAFQRARLPISGIRFPYFRTDEESLRILSDLPIEYDNSYPFWWEVGGWELKESERVLEKMRAQYLPVNPSDDFVIPRHIGSLVQIPVSLPDDDLLVDRAGLRPLTAVVDIWKKILTLTVDRGELFVLILHPERYSMLRRPFQQLLQVVRARQDTIWVAPLRDIARWWKKRFTVWVEYGFNGNHLLKMRIKRPRELNYRFYNFEISKNVKLTGILQSDIVLEEFETPMKTYPVIGVGEETSNEFRNMLMNLGFWVDEEPGTPELYSVYFERDPEMSSPYQWLEDFLAGLTGPLLRFNFWPEKYTAAFAVTGDIDAMKVQDFFSRL